MITELNFIDCTCPHCGETASFPQTYGGLVQACPACMNDLIVPDTKETPARKLPVPITTARLVLRRLVGGDWKGLMECFEDEDEESITRWLERDVKVKLTTAEQTFYLAVELREGGKFIGFVGLRLTDPRQGRIYFTLHPQFEQTDFFVEALDALLGFCFKEIRLHRVTTMLPPADETGFKLCEDVGMRREAIFLKDTENPEGGWFDSIWYAALEEEYLDPPAPA